MTIKDLLYNFINIRLKEEEIYSLQGTVISVDEDKRTCVVSPVKGADLLDVRLEADYTQDATTLPKGLFIVPSVGSLVLVTFLNKEDAFVSKFTEIDKINSIQGELIFNDGGNEGLVNIIDQTTKLNLLVTQMQAELVLIAAGILAGGGSYTPGTLSSFNKNDYEDTTVKH